MTEIAGFELKSGDLAYYETMQGAMVPLKVETITKDGDEMVARVKVTGHRYPYSKGEVLHLRVGAFLHARQAVRVRRMGATVVGKTVCIPD